MAQVIDLDGLPEPVAKAIAETVRNLKNGYQAKGLSDSDDSQRPTPEGADRALDAILDTIPTMPSLSDEAVSRESIYSGGKDTR